MVLLAFPWWLVMLSTFSCTYWPSVCLLWKMSIQILCPFFDWIICIFAIELMSSLYNLNINPLSDICFANIFSHSVGCLFILWMVSFAVQKLFIFFKNGYFRWDSIWGWLLRNCDTSLCTLFTSSWQNQAVTLYYQQQLRVYYFWGHQFSLC